MDGPPTRIIHSVGAFAPKARGESRSRITNKIERGERRIRIKSGSNIYANAENLQGGVMEYRSHGVLDKSLIDHSITPALQAGSTSPRTKSWFVWRSRMSANLSPRTSASAGNGREL